MIKLSTTTQLKRSEVEKDAYRKRLVEAEYTIRQLQDKKIDTMHEDIKALKNENRKDVQFINNLIEIIRWNVNPETAKDPYNNISMEEARRKRYN